VTYKFEIPIEPKGKKVQRATVIKGHARTYKDAKQGHYEAKVKALISGSLPPSPLTGPLYVRVEVVLPIPASYSKRKRDEAFAGLLLPTTKPDVSNCLKNIEDIMNSLVWLDDKQITEAVVTKRYGILGMWRVTVMTIDDGKEEF
jgi:Holliday junction resolvase RusA-like endonuclease